MNSRTLARTLLVLASGALSISALAATPGAAKPEARQGGAAWMLQRHDTDGDGMISLQEFQAAGDALFSRLDADGDGRLGTEELAAARPDRGRPGWGKRTHQEQRGEPRSERRRYHGLARMDADGDGDVARAEFDDARMARFNALDVNGNGVIDADEIPARMGYGKRDRCRSK